MAATGNFQGILSTGEQISAFPSLCRFQGEGLNIHKHKGKEKVEQVTYQGTQELENQAPVAEVCVSFDIRDPVDGRDSKNKSCNGNCLVQEESLTEKNDFGKLNGSREVNEGLNKKQNIDDLAINGSKFIVTESLCSVKKETINLDDGVVISNLNTSNVKGVLQNGDLNASSTYKYSEPKDKFKIPWNQPQQDGSSYEKEQEDASYVKDQGDSCYVNDQESAVDTIPHFHVPSSLIDDDRSSVVLARTASVSSEFNIDESLQDGINKDDEGVTFVSKDNTLNTNLLEVPIQNLKNKIPSGGLNTGAHAHNSTLSDVEEQHTCIPVSEKLAPELAGIRWHSYAPTVASPPPTTLLGNFVRRTSLLQNDGFGCDLQDFRQATPCLNFKKSSNTPSNGKLGLTKSEFNRYPFTGCIPIETLKGSKKNQIRQMWDQTKISGSENPQNDSQNDSASTNICMNSRTNPQNTLFRSFLTGKPLTEATSINKRVWGDLPLSSTESVFLPERKMSVPEQALSYHNIDEGKRDTLFKSHSPFFRRSFRVPNKPFTDFLPGEYTPNNTVMIDNGQANHSNMVQTKRTRATSVVYPSRHFEQQNTLNTGFNDLISPQPFSKIPMASDMHQRAQDYSIDNSIGVQEKTPSDLGQPYHLQIGQRRMTVPFYYDGLINEMMRRCGTRQDSCEQTSFNKNSAEIMDFSHMTPLPLGTHRAQPLERRHTVAGAYTLLPGMSPNSYDDNSGKDNIECRDDFAVNGCTFGASPDSRQQSQKTDRGDQQWRRNCLQSQLHYTTAKDFECFDKFCNHNEQQCFFTPTIRPKFEGGLYVAEFKNGRIDFFTQLPSETPLKINDLVIVEADRGKDLGRIVAANIESAEELKVYQERYAESYLNSFYDPRTGFKVRQTREIHPKRIYRLATSAEIGQMISKEREEEASIQVCRSKVRRKNLPMEIVDAEYQWDRKKLTFYFVSQSRIDFRGLVRDLFKLYKTRIWMCSMIAGHVSV